MPTLTIHTDPAHESDFQRYMELYDLQNFAVPPTEKQPYVIHRRDRVCRFCKKKYPLVTFRNDAHIIPESLGNRYLVSEFECDDCNHILGRLDDQLINFIGVNRALNGTKGKKETKKPDYPSNDRRVELTHTQFHNDQEATRIELAEAGNGAYKFDQANNTQTITFTKRPYTPLKVFQSLVKMGMCIMPEEEMNNYLHLIDFINSSKKKNVNYNISGALASIYLFPTHFGSDVPYLMLFKKSDQSVLAPTHVLRLVARNLFIEVKLPLHKDDHFVNSGKEIPVVDCPPLFFSPYEDIGTPSYKHLHKDLSSSTQIRNEEEQIVFSLPDKWIEKLSARNMETGAPQDITFDPVSIKGIWLSNATFNFDDVEGKG